MAEEAVSTRSRRADKQMLKHVKCFLFPLKPPLDHLLLYSEGSSAPGLAPEFWEPRALTPTLGVQSAGVVTSAQSQHTGDLLPARPQLWPRSTEPLCSFFFCVDREVSRPPRAKDRLMEIKLVNLKWTLNQASSWDGWRRRGNGRHH
ncbi:unnamed protein product [Pleuronectes platessa]|uniref:Uncharacterized protein n=1 Tax=Pleuronectes platessa TaxID=8262 RepID=A0A9N7U9X4_PLEPL|nr:unnamed protein product [Pleuronectes platessa]